MAVQPAQNRRCDDAMTIGQLMAVCRHHVMPTADLEAQVPNWHMWPAAIEMRDPTGEDLAQMRFGERDERVQTISRRMTVVANKLADRSVSVR